MAEDTQRVTEVELRQLNRNDYNPRFARARHGGDVDVDVDSLVESISEHGLASPLSVRENGDGYEVIAGERRLLALRECFGGDHKVPVTVHDLTREEAIQLAYEENEEREDLSPMDQAWYFAERVTVDYAVKGMSYAEYVNKLSEHVQTGILQVPSQDHPDVKKLGQGDGLGAKAISERLSNLLLPPEAQQWIDDDDLTIRAARLIVHRVRNGRQETEDKEGHEGVDDPEVALDMMAALAETYGPKYGSMGPNDYTKLEEDIKTRIEDYKRREKIAKEQVGEYADLFVERLGKLDEELDKAAEQFDTPYPVPEIPDGVESPDDFKNVDAVLDGVETYREVLKDRRGELHEDGEELAEERDTLENERARLNQTVRHFDKDEGECPFCRQDLAIEPVQERLSEVNGRIDEIQAARNRINDLSSDISDARSTLHRAKRNVEAARDSYKDAYETAMELNGGVV